MFELSSEVLSGLALCVPVLPLIAAVVSAVLGSTRPSLAPLVASVGVLGAFAASLLLLLATAGHGSAAHIFHYGTWFTIGHHSIDWEIRLDALATAMVCMVTFISFWIVIFSQGYMDGDPGSARFFSLVSLFVGAMAILVLANSLVVMFLGWEGVGVCSYLLVGFWFRKPEAAAAARKAFLVTRLGDVALLGALLLLACQPGSRALTFDAVFSAHLDAGIVYFVLLLLLIGAVGKSAQFPLHVWLPDAMEGPTPVSALIHAATMVTAGVYLLARFFPGMTGDSVDLSRLDAIASVQDVAGGLGHNENMIALTGYRQLVKRLFFVDPVCQILDGWVRWFALGFVFHVHIQANQMPLAFNNDRLVHGQAKVLAVPDIAHAVNGVNGKQGFV